MIVCRLRLHVQAIHKGLDCLLQSSPLPGLASHMTSVVSLTDARFDEANHTRGTGID